MPVSHEAIYTWFSAQPKGQLRDPGVALRTGREQRKPRGRKTPGAKITGMRSIEDRPAGVAGRQVPGYWEGDLERHEAPCNRAEVEGLRRWAVAAA